ncbi:MAG: hypothetical protein R3A45_11515 [Bdellovibrionota bacterium]
MSGHPNYNNLVGSYRTIILHYNVGLTPYRFNLNAVAQEFYHLAQHKYYNFPGGTQPLNYRQAQIGEIEGELFSAISGIALDKVVLGKLLHLNLNGRRNTML